MDIAAILREIDAEIEKLERIRTIVEELLSPAPRKNIRTKRRVPVEHKEVITEPKLIVLPPTLVLPPKLKREYRTRYKAFVQEPRALTSVIPKNPVFVPKAEVVARPELVISTTEFNAEALEAALRKNFVGVAS
jgi:hypothetical protein